MPVFLRQKNAWGNPHETGDGNLMKFPDCLDLRMFFGEYIDIYIYIYIIHIYIYIHLYIHIVALLLPYHITYWAYDGCT